MRVSLGGIDVVGLVDAVRTDGDPLAAFTGGGVDPRAVRRAAPVLVRRPPRIPVRCFLIRAAGLQILVDTGLGPWQRWNWPRGRLDEALAGEGVTPRDVDVVVATHLHEDHVGWNTVPGRSGGPEIAFPNATYVVQSAEWTYWTEQRADVAGRDYLRACILPLRDRADLRLVQPDQAIGPGIHLVPAPGHTPGHVALRLEGADGSLLLAGDATHFPVQVAHPEWSTAWDEDPPEAARSRRRLFESIAGDPRALLVASHWPEPGAGLIERRGKDFTFRPQPDPVLLSAGPSNQRRPV